MNHYKMEELIPIVARLSEKYTSKESSSVSYEVARNLMNAVLYCMEERDVSEGETLSSGTSLKTETLDAVKAYEGGYRSVVQKTIRTKELFETINKEFKAYGNSGYYDTVIVGMPAFFLHYDAKFNPQDHLLTLDYPTIKPIGDLCGVDAIERYLQYILLEQIFLNAFPQNLIVEALKRLYPGYKDLFINICSVVMRNVVGCMIAGKKTTSLNVEESDYHTIREFVRKFPEDKLEEKILQLIKAVVQYGYDNNQALYEYLAEDAGNFSVTLFNAVENNCLETLFS